MSKKILYIRQNMPGGTDNYCKALYHIFQNDAELQPLPVKDIPDIHSRLFHYYYKPKALHEAISRADIVHINGYTAIGSIQAFIEAKRQHKRIIYTAHWHPFEFLKHPMLGKVFFNIFFRHFIKKYANVVTTINNEDTRFFQRIHPQVRQIPHWYKSLPLKGDHQKKKNMILLVGRADNPVKGIEHLYYLPVDQYEVHCVGRGTIERKDFIQHIGITDEELAGLYAEASLLVIPSKYEAFSYAALEAMTYGTPVLMSERVRIADYLDGVRGFQRFQYGDYNEFVRKVATTIGSPVDTSIITQRFSPEKIKEQYRVLYLKDM